MVVQILNVIWPVPFNVIALFFWQRYKIHLAPAQYLWHNRVLNRRPCCKMNSRALGAALWHGLDGLNGQAQTQGVSLSEAVAASLNRLAWGKHAATLAILTQFKVKWFQWYVIFRLWQIFFFLSCEMNVSMELARNCFWPKQRYPFAQSFDQSLVVCA